jgi:hypothetical protein
MCAHFSKFWLRLHIRGLRKILHFHNKKCQICRLYSTIFNYRVLAIGGQRVSSRAPWPSTTTVSSHGRCHKPTCQHLYRLLGSLDFLNYTTRQNIYLTVSSNLILKIFMFKFAFGTNSDNSFDN